jgi:hypothetical protein
MNSKSVTLDDKVTFNLLSSAEFLDKFPNIKAALEATKNKAESMIVKKGCKPCQLRSKQISINLMSVKKAIARFSDEDKIKIKEFLKTDQLVIVFSNDKNEISKIEF